MIVDSSALVAILGQAPALRISAASLLETSIVLYRSLGPKGAILLDEFLSLADVEVVPLSPAQARSAFQAYRRSAAIAARALTN